VRVPEQAAFGKTAITLIFPALEAMPVTWEVVLERPSDK
jgi:hypothetical protein